MIPILEVDIQRIPRYPQISMNILKCKPTRKKALILMVLSSLLCLFNLGTAKALQFYKANRGARLIVYLKAKNHYSSWSHVIVTVMLSNQTNNVLLINNRMRP